MKRGGNLLIPYAAVTKAQQEQIEKIDKWLDYVPEEPEILNDEISEWAIKYCRKMREHHDSEVVRIDDMMPNELIKDSRVKKGGAFVSSDEEEEEVDTVEVNAYSEEEDNDYIVDYFDDDADAFE